MTAIEVLAYILAGFSLGMTVGTIIFSYGLDHLNHLWKEVSDKNLVTAQFAVNKAYAEGLADRPNNITLSSEASAQRDIVKEFRRKIIDND